MSLTKLPEEERESITGMLTPPVSKRRRIRWNALGWKWRECEDGGRSVLERVRKRRKEQLEIILAVHESAVMKDSGCPSWRSMERGAPTKRCSSTAATSKSLKRMTCMVAAALDEGRANRCCARSARCARVQQRKPRLGLGLAVLGIRDPRVAGQAWLGAGQVRRRDRVPPRERRARERKEVASRAAEVRAKPRQRGRWAGADPPKVSFPRWGHGFNFSSTPENLPTCHGWGDRGNGRESPEVLTLWHRYCPARPAETWLHAAVTFPTANGPTAKASAGHRALVMCTVVVCFPRLSGASFQSTAPCSGF